MKHLLTSLLLVVSFSAMAQTWDCQVPTSVLVRDHPMLENEPYMEMQFRNLIIRRGFSATIKNTRLAICLNPIYHSEHGVGGDARLDMAVSLYDTKRESVIYTVKLDTAYYGEKFEDAAYVISNDFRSSIPQLYRVLDTIRNKMLEIHEQFADGWIMEANNHIAEGNFKMAMFILAQYSSCGAKYPQVREMVASSFRELVNKDHEELLYQAKLAWKEQKSEADARFVIALLNSQQLDEGQRKKADGILKKVAKKYPSLDLTSKEDYTKIVELMEVAVRLSNRIGLEYSSMHVPETHNYIPLT